MNSYIHELYITETDHGNFLSVSYGFRLGMRLALWASSCPLDFCLS